MDDFEQLEALAAQQGGYFYPWRSALAEGDRTDDMRKFSRTVIVGNGGSGKSWLADRLASVLSVPAVDLDEIHWLPGGFNARREPAVAVEMVRTRAADDAWVIEGVFGWLANEALPRATALIWLDVPVEECIANVKARGQRSGGDAASFAALIEWVADYQVRTNANSRTAHERAFDTFVGHKFKITSRAEMAELLKGTRPSGNDGRARLEGRE